MAFLAIKYNLVNLNADIDIESLAVELRSLMKFITLLCLFICLGVNIFIFNNEIPSRGCGPFRGEKRFSDILTDTKPYILVMKFKEKFIPKICQYLFTFSIFVIFVITSVLLYAKKIILEERNKNLRKSIIKIQNEALFYRKFSKSYMENENK